MTILFYKYSFRLCELNEVYKVYFCVFQGPIGSQGPIGYPGSRGVKVGVLNPHLHLTSHSRSHESGHLWILL